MIWVLLNCFNNERALAASLERFSAKTDLEGLAWRGVVFDSQYPLTHRWQLKETTQAVGRGKWAYVDLQQNRGQSGNFPLIRDYVMAVAEPGDVMVFWDCDHNPEDPRWLKAQLDVLGCDPQCGFLTLSHWDAQMYANQGAETVVGGVTVKELCWPGGWPGGTFTCEFAEICELDVWAIYGATERNILDALRRNGLRGYMLSMRDLGTQDAFDPEYTAWKQSEIGKPLGEGLHFGEWLATRRV